MGIGNEKGGIGATVGYGSGGITYGIGGNGNSGYSWVNEKYQNSRIVYDSGKAGMTMDGVQAENTMECGYRSLASIARKRGISLTWKDFESYDIDGKPGLSYSKSGKINEFESVGAKGGIGVSKPFLGINAARAKLLGQGLSIGSYTILSTPISGNVYHATVLNRVRIRANGRVILQTIDPMGGTKTFYG